MNLEVRISKMKEVVLKSQNGHLPLFCRVELLQVIENPKIVNKIFFECVKLVYNFWIQEYPNDTILPNLLNLINKYLYRSEGEAGDFKRLADKYRNYIEGIEGRAGLAGSSVVALCYSIANNASTILDIDEYKEEDDEHFEYDVWNPDFFAAMAFSGGNPFVNEGNIEKRLDYWIWYLDIIPKLYNQPESPILQCPSLNKVKFTSKLIPQRTQTYQTPSILSKIQEIIDNTLKLYNEDHNDKWDEIILLGCFMSTGISLSGYALKKHQKKEIKVSLQSHYTLDEIKLEMYNQAKIEGAWFMCKISIDTNLKYALEFDYDDEKLIPNDEMIDPDDFKEEFKKYPRGREYTPIWWQNILGKRAKYIK